MSAPPEALRLADRLCRIMPQFITSADLDEAAAELRRLHEENFALAASQCMNVVGDEGGTPMCAKAQQLQSARERDNVSFKELLAQRDALLEALRGLLSYANVLEMRLLDADGEHRAMQQARAAIKAVEGEKG